jgi:hypothetical protein
MDITLTTIAVAGAILILIGTIWVLPHLQVRHISGLSPVDRFDRTNEARRTIAQILGGAILLGGFYFNWRGQNQTAKDNLENQSIARNGQMIDGFTKASDRLISDKLDIRAIGILGLEPLAQESGPNHWTAMEVLAIYVRTHAGNVGSFEPLQTRPKPQADVQAVTAVLRRQKRQDGDSWLDLRNTNFAGADLSGADLAWADLAGADLRWIDLSRASLKGAYLKLAHLENAQLVGTCLNGADLTGAIILPTDFKGAWWDGSTKFPTGIAPGNPTIVEPDNCR